MQPYRNVLARFRSWTEAKSAASSGQPCDRQTVGLLRRRRVRALPELLTYVGKESNRLEEVEAGLGHDPEEVWTEFADPTRDPWRALVLPVLREIPSKVLAEATGLSTRSIREIRNGHSMPRPRHRAALIRAAGDFARKWLRAGGLTPLADALAACEASLGQRPDRWATPV